MFTKALLAATYEGGKPSGQLTKLHLKAEHHRFKTEGLFRESIIPKELYVVRLIQHFLIMREIETQLKSLFLDPRNEIAAFFALNYIHELWRTDRMQQDLELLGEKISLIDKKMMPSTSNYLETIRKLPPKSLLTHFLMHIVGFMHCGSIIQSKYLPPKTQLTSYQIPANQYDFSDAIKKSSEIQANKDLFNNMMKVIDKIKLDENEYQEIAQQCNAVFETMIKIYDDLCEVYLPKPKINLAIAILALCLIPLALIVKQMIDSSHLHIGPNPFK